jgi:hypothetical protein
MSVSTKKQRYGLEEEGKGKEGRKPKEIERNEGAIKNQERTQSHEFIQLWHKQSTVSITVDCNLKTNMQTYTTEVF